MVMILPKSTIRAMAIADDDMTIRQAFQQGPVSDQAVATRNLSFFDKSLV
jgi:hypothetical protein